MTKYSARLTLVVSLLCLSTLGCGGHPGPTSATPTPGAVNPDPLPPSPAVRPSIATIAPDSGSIDGGAWSTITGTDFQPGATVQLGQQKAKQIVVKSTTVVVFWTEARAAGVVDVTVTNPGGLSATLRGSYTYAPPASFDPDGEWIAHAGPDFDIELHLTFTFGRLVDATCGAHRVVLSSSSTVENGEFASGSDDGMALAGRLVSPVNAVGTLTFDGCASGQWWAEKRSALTTITATMITTRSTRLSRELKSRCIERVAGDKCPPEQCPGS